MKKLVLAFAVMIFAMAFISSAALAATVNDNDNSSIVNQGNQKPAAGNNDPVTVDESNNDPADTDQNQGSGNTTKAKKQSKGKGGIKILPLKKVKEMVN